MHDVEFLAQQRETQELSGKYHLMPEAYKWPQIDAAFRYILDNPQIYENEPNLVDIFEFGVYKANSLVKICNYIRNNNPYFSPQHNYVWGFDSFGGGLPEEAPGVEVFSKYGKGTYDTEEFTKDPINYIKEKVNYPSLFLRRKQFSELNKNDLSVRIGRALLIHIDCDLYLSTKDALDFMFKFDLIGKHTLIAFDEYRSTNTLAGEEKAFCEILEKYKAGAEEIWHTTYIDKQTQQRFRQSLWEITKL